MIKKILFSAALATTFFLICFSSAQVPKSKGTLVYATGTDALTLDPQFATDIPTARVIMQIHETLVKYDVDMNLVPGLAESWDVSDDLLTWKFKLQKGVRFHDGTPFNAEAVKYTFDRLMDPGMGSPRRNSVDMVKEVKALDDNTVVFTMEKPFAPFLNQLTGYNTAIISPTAARKAGKNYGGSPAGTGPFKFYSRILGEKIILLRNDTYWGKKPYLEQLIFRVVPENERRVMLLQKEEVDAIASVPANLLKKLTRFKGVKVIREKGFRTIYLGFNNSMKPFNDIRVRRAVSLAINKKAILENLLMGVGSLGGGLESPAIPGGSRDLKPYPYDPAGAKKLLKEAGYPNGFETTLYTPTGRYFMDRPVAEAIRSQLKDVGITATVLSPDWGTLTSLLEKGTEAPMFLMGKGSPTGDLDLTLNLMIRTGGSMNYFRYSNRKVDKLIEIQQATIDARKRFEILYEIQKIVYEECPAVVLFYEDQIFARRATVHGIEVYANEMISFGRATKL